MPHLATHFLIWDRLRFLDISGNSLGPDAASVLVKGVQANRTLQVLKYAAYLSNQMALHMGLQMAQAHWPCHLSGPLPMIASLDFGWPLTRPVCMLHFCLPNKPSPTTRPIAASVWPHMLL